MASHRLKYLSWHCLKKPKQILMVIKNFLAFGAYFFSAKELLFSLFAPWKRQIEDYGKGFDFEVYFRVFSGNLISRVIGCIVRIIFLIAFLIFEIIVFILGIISLIIWFFLPLILIAGFAYGIKLIFAYV
jgi:hypothetical protein